MENILLRKIVLTAFNRLSNHIADTCQNSGSSFVERNRWNYKIESNYGHSVAFECTLLTSVSSMVSLKSSLPVFVLSEINIYSKQEKKVQLITRDNNHRVDFDLLQAHIVYLIRSYQSEKVERCIFNHFKK